MSKNLHAEVTARILTQLKEGHVPWIKPWKSMTLDQSVPANAITSRPYSGTNTVLLWMAGQAKGYSTARYLTYKQCQEAGGQVRRGEKGYRVIYARSLIVRDRETEQEKSVPMLREFIVFNVDQCDGLDLKGPSVTRLHDEQRDELTEAFLSSTGASIREGVGEAYYVPSKDYVSIPAFPFFKSKDSYYSILFHELGHWTGAKKRLDRDLSNRFGTIGYAAEELVAELTAAFVCAEFGYDNDLRHAGYIATWIRLLSEHDKAFIHAASQATRAVEYLRSQALADSVNNVESVAA